MGVIKKSPTAIAGADVFLAIPLLGEHVHIALDDPAELVAPSQVGPSF